MNIAEGLKIKNPEKAISVITEFIRKNVKAFHREGAVIGVSGGIDSALGAFLTVKAIGNENVLALFLPERDSSKQSEQDARLVAEKLGIKLKKIDITPIVKATGAYGIVPSAFGIPRKVQEKYVINRYKAHQDEEETTFLKTLKGGEGSEEIRRGTAFHRIKHRIRMVMWYYYAELNNYIVIGNCNKSEKLTGYFVKYGDSGSDIDPIANLYKSQVKQLASYIGVPERIIEKAPSPDLLPGITDEFALQITYEKLDKILFGLEHDINEKEIMNQANASEREINYVKKLVELSAHMRNLPPSPKI